jgi:heptaprenylglyceryl phosphate synthase
MKRLMVVVAMSLMLTGCSSMALVGAGAIIGVEAHVHSKDIKEFADNAYQLVSGAFTRTSWFDLTIPGQREKCIAALKNEFLAAQAIGQTEFESRVKFAGGTISKEEITNGTAAKVGDAIKVGDVVEQPRAASIINQPEVSQNPAAAESAQKSWWRR